MKAVINYVWYSNIKNNHYGAQTLFLDNIYACPEIFAIIGKDMNLIGVGT